MFHRRHRRRSRRRSGLRQHLARSWLFSYLCAHRFLALQIAMACIALGAALSLSWPSSDPGAAYDRREAWRRSLTAAPHAATRTRAEAAAQAGGSGGDAATVSVDVSSKERNAGPRLMAKLERAVAPEPERPAPPPAVVAAPPVATEPASPVVEPLGPAQVRAGPPPWLRNAVAADPMDGRPVIALVVDDLGLNRRHTAEVIGLPAPLTLAFLPYAGDLRRQAREARAAGHELLLHVPMEPIGLEDPGPDALLASLPDDELRRRLRRDMASMDGYVGINNHMGSKLTADRRAMALVMDELRNRGLLFIDSRTSPLTVAGAEAHRSGVPHAGRDVFLDNEADVGSVRAQLDLLESVARRTGAAIGIGHPYPETVAALAEWLPTVEARGFSRVPVSALVARRLCRDGSLPAACRAYAALRAP
ncbi:MAG TPA: divergent polysaccharide deacetylase family protein [Geminicoccaceae bacterium]|nr:divergent polysaccharide deacetylase family protein [Geminicoccaceae bacterium]